jgi:type IV pilus assembly protein PilA
MLSKSKKSISKGFTIIEVMIVLAIAGLILLIVFLAVPALQRNARNTSIKSDAGNVSGGISTFESNNNGTVPTTLSGTGTVTISAGGSTTADKFNVGGSTVVANAAAGTKPFGASGTALTAPALGTITVYLGYRCDNTSSTRAAAVVYSIENSSSTAQAECIDT